MNLAEATVTKRGNHLDVKHGDDSGLIVEFYLESEHQGAASREAGRPIYKDVPYIWIRFPGNRNREVKRRVDKTGRLNGGMPDAERFPRQWAAFQNQQAQPQEGTPLEEWAPITRSLALTYKGMNIFTVENLAAVPDSALGSMGHGAREMRDKAQTWLASANDSSEVLALREENETLKNDVEALKRQFAELEAKPKRGRPRKKPLEEA